MIVLLTNIFALCFVSKHLATFHFQVRCGKRFHVGRSLRHGCVQMAPCVDRTGWDQTMASPSSTTSCLLFSLSSSVSPWRAGLNCSTGYVLPNSVWSITYTLSDCLMKRGMCTGKASHVVKVERRNNEPRL